MSLRSLEVFGAETSRGRLGAGPKPLACELLYSQPLSAEQHNKFNRSLYIDVSGVGGYKKNCAKHKNRVLPY